MKQYKKCEIERIITQINKDFEIVEYNKELYRNKNEKYKVFIHTLFSMENVNISDKDIDIYISERKKYGRYVACINLSDKYSQNILIKEIERILEKIEFKKNYKKSPDEYKSFRDITKIYDYDDERQLQILELASNDKYIMKELNNDITKNNIELI